MLDRLNSAGLDLKESIITIHIRMPVKMDVCMFSNGSCPYICHEWTPHETHAVKTTHVYYKHFD